MAAETTSTYPTYIPRPRIGIVGLGIVSSLGHDVPTAWQNLIAGETGVRDIRDSHLGPYQRVMETKIGAPVIDFDLMSNPLFKGRYPDGDKIINIAKERKNFHVSHEYGIHAAYQAMGDGHTGAGILLPNSLQIDPSIVAHEEAGVVMGTGLAGGYALVETKEKIDAELRRTLGPKVTRAYVDYINETRKALDLAELTEDEEKALLNGQVKPSHMQQSLIGRTPEIISLLAKMKAAVKSNLGECAASAEAIADAADQIILGRAKVVVAGGTEAAMMPSEILAFERHKGAVTSNSDYRRSPKPLDKNRDGFVFGEGAAVVVLEELGHAMARGAHVYAELIGWGTSGDAHDPVEPDPRGVKLSFTRALQMAGLRAEEISDAYVNLHVPGTPADIKEASAFTDMLEPEQTVGFNGTKGQTGHALGGVGAMETIFTTMALENNVVPASVNMTDPETIVEHYPTIMGESVDADIEVGVKNSSGFGGHNATLILKKHSQKN